MRQMRLGARAYHRVLKLGRTIADLAGSDIVAVDHIAEALQYRQSGQFSAQRHVREGSMDLLVINAAEVRKLLPMAACMEAMASALMALGRGEAQNPLRSANWLPQQRGILLAMPALTEEAMAIKVITVMPGNHGTPYDSHMGAVILFDAQYGRPLALMDATEITAIRTAAVSGLATQLLAREDAGDLAILGTGVQARSHLQAMLEARPLRRVRVWSRSAANREAFVRWAGADLDVEVEAVDSAQAAVTGADLICTTTATAEPVILGDWLAPGSHINAVGASTATTRELDSAAMAMVSHFVDQSRIGPWTSPATI